jgi:hypothetical protein
MTHHDINRTDTELLDLENKYKALVGRNSTLNVDMAREGSSYEF